MKKNILVIFLLLFCGLIAVNSAAAQTYEYGKPDELKGLAHLYIDTGDSVNDHDLIKDEIEKSGLKLVIADKYEDADFVLMFVSRREERATGAVQTGNLVLMGRREFDVGKGLVLTTSADGKKLRVLMNYQSMRAKSPAAKFAREFIKAYKKANGIK